MAHMYLCKPQSLVRTLTATQPNTHLDEVVNSAGRRGDFSPHPALTSSSNRSAAQRTGSTHQPPQLVQTLPEEFDYAASTAPSQHTTACVAAHRCPSSNSTTDDVAAPPPPPYTEAQARKETMRTSPSQIEDIERVIKLLHAQVRSASPAAAADLADVPLLHGSAAPYAAAAPKPPVVTVTKGKRTRIGRNCAPEESGLAKAPKKPTLRSGRKSAETAASAVAFAQNFLVEYEALSRRDLIIDYYATLPQPSAVPLPAAAATASAVASSTPPLPPPMPSLSPEATRQAIAAADTPVPSTWRRCRLVFPGSLWNSVLQLHRKFLRHALVCDAEAALPFTSVSVSSLHASSAELEVILSVAGPSQEHVSGATILNECAFDGVWEVYNLASSTLATNGQGRSPPLEFRATRAPLPQQPSVKTQSRARGYRDEQGFEEEDEDRYAYVDRPQSPSVVRGVSRVGGAPWRQSRRHISNRGATASSQSELVVPLVFATAVTNKLRRAARSGANGDLHVALRRDGLYAVPSAKEVRVRATRVNAEGLYVELIFRWQEGEEMEENAEEAMDEAPFTDTWKFLEDCQPPTATTVLQTKVKREAAAEPRRAAADPPSRQQPEQVAPPALPRRVDACTATRAHAPLAAPTHDAVKVRSIVCEVPLTSPEWRAVAAHQPGALRAALKADVTQLAREALASAQVHIGSPRAAANGSLSIGFELDAVPERVAQRVRAASFPKSFPHLAGLSPVAAKPRVSMGTSVPSFAEPAHRVNEGADKKGSTIKVTQTTQTAQRSPMSVSDGTVSEDFSLSDVAPLRQLVSAATQTSRGTPLHSSALVTTSSAASAHPGEGSSSHANVAEAISVSFPTPTPRLPEVESASFSREVPASQQSSLPMLVAAEECAAQPPKVPQTQRADDDAAEAHEEMEERRSGGGSRNSLPAHEDSIAKSLSAELDESDDQSSKGEASMPAEVITRSVCPYVQGAEAPDVSFVSLQVTEVVPSVAAPAAAAETKPLPKGTRLSFSMEGEKWGTLLNEYPVLLKRALRSDVQELFGVPPDALGDLVVHYDDRLHVEVRVEAGVPLKPNSAVSASLAPLSGADLSVPVQRLPHLWDLYDQQPQQHMVPPPTHSSKLTTALSSTRRPKEEQMMRRQVTDGRAVLKGSLKAVHIAAVESLPSPTTTSPSQSSQPRASRVVSTYQVQLPGTMWNSILGHQCEEVSKACVADVEGLLAGQISQLSVDAMTVDDDGRLCVDVSVPLTALPCELNPPQFRWALSRLPLTHLQELHDRATSCVPITLTMRRFFNAPALTDDVLQREESAIRTLFLAETCAKLNTSDDNVMRLVFSEHLVADITMRVPRRTDAEAWQRALMEHDYPALTDYLQDLTTAKAPLQAPRRATLLSSSSLMVSQLSEESASIHLSVSNTKHDSDDDSKSDDNPKNSSAHAVLLAGPLWPTVLEEHAEELREVVLADATTSLAPLSVTVEKLTQAIHGGTQGALFTFLLLSPASTELRDVESALQGCPFDETKALYARIQSAVDSANANRTTSTAYAMQLDGEAWLEVADGHRKEMADTFALEALTCLRDDAAVAVPVGVAVREVVPKASGVLLCYNVVSSAAADAVDRFRVAEAVEQYGFPLLWELYDRVMLTRQPFRDNTNPDWIASRRQRLLSTAYSAAAEPPHPRSYSFVGYSDEVDLESYLQHAFPAASANASETPPKEEALASQHLSTTMDNAVGQAEYDFKHLPAPSLPPPTETVTKAVITTAPTLPRLVAREETPPTPVPAPVARQLNMMEARPPSPPLPPAPLATQKVREAPQQLPPLPLPDMDKQLALPNVAPPQRQGRQHSHSHKCSDAPSVAREKKRDQRARSPSTQPPTPKHENAIPATLVATEEEEGELHDEDDEDDEYSATTADETTTDADESDDNVGAVTVPYENGTRNSPVRTVGTIVIAGTLTVTPTRPPDVKRVAAPARAKTIARIPLSPPVVIPRRIPAPPSRQQVDAPEITSAKQIEAPVRLRSGRSQRTAVASAKPRHPAPAPVPEVARQSRPTKTSPQRKESEVQKALVPPRLGGGGITMTYHDQKKSKAGAPAQHSLLNALREAPTAGQAPALSLPLMNRHSAAPITVMDVRMTHPPLNHVTAPGNVVPRSPALSAGVSLATAPLRSASRKATLPERPPSRVAEASQPTLPVLRTTAVSPPVSELALPPTNQSKTSDALPSQKLADATASVASQTAMAPAATAASRRVSPAAFLRQVTSARWVDKRVVTSMAMADAAEDSTPPPRATSSFSSPSSSSLFASRSSSPASMRVHGLPPPPLLSERQPSASRASPAQSARKAPSPSVPDVLSNGPSASLASSSLHGSMATPPRGVARETKGESTPQLSLPKLRTDQASVVAVTTHRDDRLKALCADLSSVEQSMRTRYPRMERELMVAAKGASVKTAAASAK